MMRDTDWEITAIICFSAGSVLVAGFISVGLSPLLSGRFIESGAIFIRILLLVFLAFAAVISLCVPGWYEVHIDGRFTIDPSWSKTSILEEVEQAHFYATFSLWEIHMETSVLSKNRYSMDPNVVTYQLMESQMANRNRSRKFTWRTLHFCEVPFGYGPAQSDILDKEYLESLNRNDPIPATCMLQYLSSYGIRNLESPPPISKFKTASLWSRLSLCFALASLIIAVIFLHSIIMYGAAWLVITGIFFLATFFIQLGLILKDDETSKLFTMCHSLARSGVETFQLPLNPGWVLILCCTSGVVAVICGILVLILDLRFPLVSAKLFSVDVSTQEPLNSFSSPPKEHAITSSVTLGGDVELKDISEQHSQPHRRESILNKLQAPRRGPRKSSTPALSNNI